MKALFFALLPTLFMTALFVGAVCLVKYIIHRIVGQK